MPHSEEPHRATSFGLPLAPASETALDPVCGMTVDPTSAADSFIHKGTTYHFCSHIALRVQSRP